MANYKESATPDLLTLFAQAAAEQGEALRGADPRKANSRYRTMKKISLELKARGPEAQLELLSLFNHADGYVRLNAAAYALEFDPHSALRVLEILDKMETGLLGFTAGMAIKYWREKQTAKA